MNLTKNIAKCVLAIVITAFALTSCIKEDSLSNKEREQISLDAWIRLHKPELIGNYQENGGYYVEILDGDTNEGIAADGLNDFGSEPIMEQDSCWVYVNMTGRSINGTICLTRNGELADMCGTFSHFTHYVPYINYAGSVNMGLLEGSYLAMRNELILSNDYCTMHNIKKPYYMRKGSKVRLYLTSSIAYGETGSSIQGGYEGQYTLDGSRPLILDIEVLRTIKNPSERELDMVGDFISHEIQWTQGTKPESEKEDEKDDLKLKGLYYSLDFQPSTTQPNLIHEKYIKPETGRLNNRYTDSKKYANMEEVNAKINQILLERFGEGLPKSKQTEDTQVTKSGNANIWYILRFLDGFVVDTNIAELRTYIFGETSPVCEPFNYTASDDEGKEEDERSAIGAWYYCIPQMHYGAYGQIVTTSGYAYGSTGVAGTTTTESSSSSDATTDYYNAMNYYNYYNSYYDYYNQYYNYYDYNYYNYNYNTSSDSGEVTTTTTISTEILPYTPLVFTLYVEPNE